MDSTQRDPRNPGAYIGATLLILIGVFALLANLAGGAYVYESIPLAMGVAFAVGYILTRHYGFLVPAGILTGVGAGVLASTSVGGADAGAYVVISIGLGFLAIYAFDVLVTGTAIRWWPLIPGGLMLLIGAGMANTAGFVHQLQIWAPALLIALGVLILISRARQSRHS